jgi:hypothetical protein
MIEPGEDYAFARPSLTDKKLRALELRAGMPSRRGQKGKAAAYSIKDVRRSRASSLSRASVHTASSSPTGRRTARRGDQAWPPPMGRD